MTKIGQRAEEIEKLYDEASNYICVCYTQPDSACKACSLKEKADLELSSFIQIITKGIEFNQTYFEKDGEDPDDYDDIYD